MRSGGRALLPACPPPPRPLPALPLQLYTEAVPQFQEFLLAAMDSDLRTALLQLEVSAGPGSAGCPRQALAVHSAVHSAPPAPRHSCCP